MSLAAGTRLGPYEVLGLIGAGGMGEVYKAHDTRLDRTVAIKVLPADISADPDRRARFDREAKTIAGLTHPHICTLHDVSEHAGSMFLVMEHLDGETLAHRIAKGPLPIDQALTIAIDIADALSAAHRHGVIHRDLKPGNVMLTKSGAKLLDFGLAKLTGHGEQGTLAMIASAPTRSAPLTGEGVIVGTLQYMAPEQLEGRPADARTDLWALGAILYEMITGKRAFEGRSAASLMGAILEREPVPPASLHPFVPRALDRFVRQCLAKTPDDRPDTAHDVSNELRSLCESGVHEPARPARGHSHRRTALGVLAVVPLAAVVAVWAWSELRTPVRPLPIVRSSLDVRPAEALVTSLGPTALAWTPDGRSLVFVGRRDNVVQLYVRTLDATEARPLPNTEGASPFAISPDGQWVAFWARRAFVKVPLAGGPPVTLAAGVPQRPLALTWDSQGRLCFGSTSGPEFGLWEIQANGTIKALSKEANGSTSRRIPSSHLQNGRVLLATIRKRWDTWGDERVVAIGLADGTEKVLLNDAADARYLPTGHLVFLRRGVLLAAPFDASRLEITGDAVPLLDSVAQAIQLGSALNSMAGQYGVSSKGDLAWVQASVRRSSERELVRVDRQGKVTELPCPRRSYATGVRVSPDGTALAVSVSTLTDYGIWTCDLGSGLLSLVAGGDEADSPLWSADGKLLYYLRLKDGQFAAAVQTLGQLGEPRVLPTWGIPASLTRDGHMATARDGDIMLMPLDDSRPSEQPLLATSSAEAWPDFSPDGRWLAYGSDRTGRTEVYVSRIRDPAPLSKSPSRAALALCGTRTDASCSSLRA
jgi:eukaryotic-like serine/threonine-protein kinase